MDETEGVNVYLTIDREQEGWDGHVGFVPNYLKEIGFDTNKTALVCGPPIMIKIRSGRTGRAGLLQRSGIYHTGASYEMRCRKMRPLQHRRQIRLQRTARYSDVMRWMNYLMSTKL